jgi:hypothetical protein
MEGLFLAEECVICLEPTVSRIFRPCRHACCCADDAAAIIAAGMECPICRADIVDNDELTTNLAEVARTLVVACDFDRADYIRRLRRPISRAAVGKGSSINNAAFSRLVSGQTVGALDEAEQERKGTDRYGAGKKATITVSEAGLQVVFKVGRKQVSETYEPCLDWKTAVEDPTTPLEMATKNPSLYWHWHYHTDGDVEGELKRSGLLQSKRRR